MLLYFAPQDNETAQIVQELEAQAYEKGTLVLRKDPVALPSFNVKSAYSAIQGDPDHQKKRKIHKIQALQMFLQKVERYRTVRDLRERENQLIFESS